MQNLNYLHLLHFYKIASEGQIARAARLLRVGQPTLSTQLKQLEDVLGYRLFERKKGETLKLTEKGKTIFAYAQEIFRLGDEMLHVSSGMKSTRSTHLRVGALDAVPKTAVLNLIEAAHRKAPCTFTVFEEHGFLLNEGLVSHRFDLTIGNVPAPHRADIELRSRKIAQSPVVICGTRRFVQLKRKYPISLISQPFILPTPDGKVRAEVDDFFRRKGVQVDIIGEAQDGEVLKLAALSGRAMAPFSRTAIKRELAQKELFVIGELEGAFEELWISCALRLVDHPIVNHLMSGDISI